MSYDLNFWKYKNGVYLNNQSVYEKCSNGEIVDGLEELAIDNIRQQITKKFSKWKMEESDNDWENSKGEGAFQIFHTTQFIRFDCYEMNGDDMNKIIDIMLKFDCPLYDPQVSQRYDNH